MNILNESLLIREHHDGCIVSWASDTCVIPKDVISWECINCNVCIGRKYNREHGCPICGAKLHKDEYNYYTNVCAECGCIMKDCGGGDIKAIIIPMFIEPEDTI